MAFCVLYQNIHPDSIKPLFTFLVIVGTELFYKSGSGLIALFMIIIYLMFCSRNKYINKLANAKEAVAKRKEAILVGVNQKKAQAIQVAQTTKDNVIQFGKDTRGMIITGVDNSKKVVTTYVKDTMESEEGVIFTKWYSTMCRLGIPIEWENMI